MAILATREILAHFILIGDGEDRMRLEGLAAEQGLQDRVHFRGAIYDEAKIANHMALAQAAIIPEAGLPIIHPMAYGVVPVISDDIERHGTEWEAVIEGKTGYFFRDEDAASLADCLAHLVTDQAGTRSVGEAARALAFERYGADAHAERIVEGVRKLSGG
jgi:glycosyltransferase involved in cell wall biosynthesis